MNTSEMREESRKDPDTLEREIEATRADVGETLDALQARLSPGQLLDQALGFVRENGGEFARNLGDSMKQNPVPTILTGIGLAWMMASQGTRGPSRHESYGYAYGESFGDSYGEAYGDSYDEDMSSDAQEGIGDKVNRFKSEAAEGIGDKVNRLKAGASAARERVAGAAGSMSHRVGSGRDQARLQAQRARESFSRMVEDQPLVLGAMGIALGAMIGALLPASEAEDRLVGETSDRIKRRATAMGEEQLDRAHEKVRTATRGNSGSDEFESPNVAVGRGSMMDEPDVASPGVGSNTPMGSSSTGMGDTPGSPQSPR